jgi:hypothetical protein
MTPTCIYKFLDVFELLPLFFAGGFPIGASHRPPQAVITSRNDRRSARSTTRQRSQAIGSICSSIFS